MNRMTKVKMYINSFSTKLALFVGILMYITYGFKEKLWPNLFLIGVCLFVAIFLPHFTKLIDLIEKKFELVSGKLFVGKVGRFAPQLVFNLVVLLMFSIGNVVHWDDLNRIGGPVGAAALTTLASQGLQYVAISLSNRDKGNSYVNVTIALSVNSVVTALAALGFGVFQTIFVIGGIILGIIGVGYSLITDMMSIFAPKGGIGIYFGTFNPVHKTHIKLIKEFIEKRNLEKVFVHPTVVPKGHQQMLDEGKIRIAKMEGGMRFYEKTEKADVHANYFPTGNKFFEIENRIVMLNAAIRENGLEDKVEVICYPEIYAKDGFYGIIKLIKKQYKGRHIHGLHGSDVGGMLVRAIYDESFGIWPYSVRRTDNVSATAIRKGAVGMTSKVTSEILDFLKREPENEEMNVLNEKYKFVKQRLVRVAQSEAKVSE
jgi:nicotinic acid mononucleotide adenylyltransferase